MSQMTFKGFTDGPDLRPFACDWESCNKDFKRRSDLTRHYKIHTNERPHPCTAPGCEKRFIQRSALAVHTRTHTGEKPHKCKYPGCTKRFSDSSSLARHRHVHTGSRSRRCAHIDCPKSFCRNKLAVRQRHHSQQRDIFGGQIDCISDSESSRSSSMPAQPSTPQPLHGIGAHHVSALQGSIFQHTPPASDLDGQVHICCLDEPFHSPHTAADELQDITTLHRFSSMPLYSIGQGNAHIETMSLDDQYTGSIGQSAMDLSYSNLGLNTTPHNSPASLQSTSTQGALSQKGYHKYMGLQNSTYPLKTAASLAAMAFHGGLLPSMAAAAADTLPSITNTLMRPWRPSPVPRQQADVTAGAETARTSSVVEATEKSARPQLPDFLQEAPTHALKAITPNAMAPTDVRASISGLGRVGLLAANPILRRPYFQPVNTVSSPLVNLFMRSTPAVSSPLRAMSTTRILSGTLGMQHRGFGTSNGISRSQLASVEESANRNPGNANLQNAFYQLLLRANMPGILVERYQTGRFATNAGTEDAYKRALAALNSGTSTTVATATATPGFARGQWAGNEQAIANAALSGSMGVKGEPIHVVVQESTRSLVFRWVKFFATFIVFTYLCFAAVTILIETLSTFRRGPGAKTDSEVKAEKQTTRFDDVHGCDEAKEELQEVVEFLRNPDSFSDLGAKLPKGVLLVGPPGTGKTLLARAVAGEAGVPFFYMSGSEFDEIFVGVGAKRVRELFAAAKAKSPAIIFIDELDAIGGKRNPRDQAHSKQTLNQLLTELDGFDTDTKIIIMAATNLPKLLDKALTRPGRFDRHINVDLPDVRGRIAILKHHAKKIRLAPDVDLDSIAARAPGQSGADLENMLNVAALRASRAKAREVSKQDIDWAFDRITMGAERKSMVVTEKEKEMTAYHEAGHALVQLFEKESSNRLYKVTILPKGPSLGHTAHVPAMDKYSYTAAEYMSNIRVLLGGKMAEEMRYGDDKVTSGVSNDLERATDLSFMMVTHFGMSNALGPVEYGRRYENLSSETKAVIEGEVQKTLRKSYEDVRKVLTEKRKELDLLAQALVQYETLDKEEVEKVIRGEKLPGRTVVPKGPLTLPIPDEIPRPPGLGVPQPHPPETPAPPASARSSAT
ncbi:hypothetical protein TrVGV298_010122 [Trichoderma virens]|nr:hypothetical protein TrVGV298_010122 [Trichoderma virens]